MLHCNGFHWLNHCAPATTFAHAVSNAGLFCQLKSGCSNPWIRLRMHQATFIHAPVRLFRRLLSCFHPPDMQYPYESQLIHSPAMLESLCSYRCKGPRRKEHSKTCGCSSVKHSSLLDDRFPRSRSAAFYGYDLPPVPSAMDTDHGYIDVCTPSGIYQTLELPDRFGLPTCCLRGNRSAN